MADRTRFVDFKTFGTAPQKTDNELAIEVVGEMQRLGDGGRNSALSRR